MVRLFHLAHSMLFSKVSRPSEQHGDLRELRNHKTDNTTPIHAAPSG